MATLSIAVPASAETTETIEGVAAPPAEPPAEEEAPAVPPGPETGAVAATPDPAAAALESVQAQPVQTDVEEAPKAVEEMSSTVPVEPVATADVDRVLPRSASIADSAADAASKAVKQAGIDADALPAPIHRPSDLLDPVVQASEEEQVPTAQASTPEHQPAGAPKPARVGVPLTEDTSVPELLSGKSVIEEAAASAAGEFPLPTSPNEAAARVPTGSVANAGALSATNDVGNRPAGDHGPSDLPPPAPDSPAGAVTGSGSTTFVPIAALLALLALAAPATMRRLGRAPDFQVSTRFVCALERPG